MEEIFSGQLAVFVFAVVCGVLFRYIGLPSLVGQVGAGLLVGVSGLLGRGDVEVLKALGSFGITLLLFLVGLEMNWHELRKVGKSTLFIFLGQTVLIVGLFFGFGKIVFGLSDLGSLFIAIALAFSSTIVLVKMLSEKKNLNSFSGKLSLGVLLLQDMLAIVLLAVLPGFKEGISLSILGWLGLKLLILFIAVNVIGHILIARLLKEVIKSGEDLILFSLAWFFVVVILSEKMLGLSAEVASFLAGLSLSTTWGHFQIINKVKTLRDVFLTMFFVVLGMQVGVGKLNWPMVIGLSATVIFGKFIITYIWSIFSGVGSRVAFLVAINVTQISEFSLVIMGLGLVSGLWNSEVAMTVTVAGLLTMTISTILIGSSEKIFSVLKRRFRRVFDMGNKRDYRNVEMKNHLILLGCDRTGKSVVSFLEKSEIPFLVVDFNPDIILKMKEKGINAIFADASDPDLVDIVNMRESRLIISTIKDKNDTLALLTDLANKEIRIPVIVDAETAEEARELYQAGAAYVVLPHFVSGWHVSQLVKKSVNDSEVFEKFRNKQKGALKTIYEG